MTSVELYYQTLKVYEGVYTHKDLARFKKLNSHFHIRRKDIKVSKWGQKKEAYIWVALLEARLVESVEFKVYKVNHLNTYRFEFNTTLVNFSGIFMYPKSDIIIGGISSTISIVKFSYLLRQHYARHSGIDFEALKKSDVYARISQLACNVKFNEFGEFTATLYTIRYHINSIGQVTKNSTIAHNLKKLTKNEQWLVALECVLDLMNQQLDRKIQKIKTTQKYADVKNLPKVIAAQHFSPYIIKASRKNIY